MLEELKESVCQANLDLVRLGLVVFTWGNVSGIDREKGLIVIKPSGVSYAQMKPGDMVVLDLQGNKVEGEKKASSDAPTHVFLYLQFPKIGGVVHTHSTWATSWAQARRPIPAYGTTHADYFQGEIPCTRPLTREEVSDQYELNTGVVIVETFKDLDPMAVPGVLVSQHGPFSWGIDENDAVHHAKVMDEVARMAYYNESLGNTIPVDPYLLNKHYERKHGEDAYYGQDQ
jgi:L-ribulose-5-phosphate 4-epimerase